MARSNPEPNNQIDAETRLSTAFSMTRSSGHEVAPTYLDARLANFDTVAHAAAESILLQTIARNRAYTTYNKYDFEEKMKDCALDATIRRVTSRER